MIKTDLNNLIEVYKYLYNKKEADISIQSGLGLIMGISEWSSLSGEAQAILKNTISENDPIEKEIKENFIDKNPLEGTKWIFSPSVSKGDFFTSEYSNTFYKLAELSKEAQFTEIKKYSVLFERYLKILNLKEPNLVAMLFCRYMKKSISEKILKDLLLAKNINSFTDILIGEDEQISYLSEGSKRVIPGRVLDLNKQFPWLFSPKEV